MIATFWFLIKTCFIIIALVWFFSLNGAVSITVESYQFTASLGVFVAIMLVLGWVTSIIMRALYFIVDVPHQMSVYREKRGRAKGLQSLAYGLSSVAAGDVRAAKHYTKKLGKYLKDDFGLKDLLVALTARLDGDKSQTRQSFHDLMNHPETSFLGLKGLLQTALVDQDVLQARDLAQKAYDKHPKQTWIIKVLYDLNIQAKRYGAAIDLLKPAVKYKAFDKVRADEDRSVLYYADGYLEKALKVNPTSLPLGLLILQKWADEGKRRKSIGLIQRLWAVHPHPSLLDYWIRYAPKKAMDNKPAMAAWMEDLYQMNPNNAASALYCGEGLINLGQGQQAQRFVKQAIALHPTMRAYQLMHHLAPDEGWMDQVPYAKHDQAWVCKATGKIFGAWAMTNDAGSFNSIEWVYPDDVKPSGITNFEISSLLVS